MKHKAFIAAIIALLGFIGAASWFLLSVLNEKKMLQKIIERLLAESRIAQVIVADTCIDPRTQKALTTIKFLEFDTKGNPLTPKYFTFFGNVIQFQSLVIRFDDFYVTRGHPLKGKSAAMFLKAFSLDDKDTQVFQINKAYEIPSGYQVEGMRHDFQKKIWHAFWEYALDPKEARKVGIKNAQIEAPGTKFLPGLLYTITIEHDGGMRIDAQRLPEILHGEKVNF